MAVVKENEQRLRGVKECCALCVHFVWRASFSPLSPPGMQLELLETDSSQQKKLLPALLDAKSGEKIVREECGRALNMSDRLTHSRAWYDVALAYGK